MNKRIWGGWSLTCFVFSMGFWFYPENAYRTDTWLILVANLAFWCALFWERTPILMQNIAQQNNMPGHKGDPEGTR